MKIAATDIEYDLHEEDLKKGDDAEAIRGLLPECIVFDVTDETYQAIERNDDTTLADLVTNATGWIVITLSHELTDDAPTVVQDGVPRGPWKIDRRGYNSWRGYKYLAPV